ncbi:MAG: hypothetical protein AVDCRST_MAG93-5902, partial [uncultured Chloroflexia bacterium]
ALAGVCRSTVKNALREAHRLGLIRVEERRLTAWRNAPNRVTVVSTEWLAWMRLRSRGGGGGKVSTPTNTHSFQEKAVQAEAWGTGSRMGRTRRWVGRMKPYQLTIEDDG